MILAFVLSMPRTNSWNGRWSGENDLYARVVNFGRSKKAEDKGRSLIGDHHYDFGDGWAVRISVKSVTAKEAASIRRKSKGFCGYDWMIDSLKSEGKIISPVIA